MKIFKTLIGRYQYRRYLKYKNWNNTCALNALYKSFHSGYKKAKESNNLEVRSRAKKTWNAYKLWKYDENNEESNYFDWIPFLN